MMKTTNTMKHAAYLLASISILSTLGLTNLSFASSDHEEIKQTGRIKTQQDTEFDRSRDKSQLKDYVILLHIKNARCF